MTEILANDPGVASQIQITDCVSEVDNQPKSSAISQWVGDVIDINHLATSPDVISSSTLSQMLVAAMVGATENYFRSLFTDLVYVCPWTASNVAADPIPFAAVHAFSANKVGFGLVEGTLFSSRGVVNREIKRFTKYQIPKESSLAKAIATFDSVCAIRHAAVHWAGRFDTRAHDELDPVARHRGQHCIDLDISSMQDCMAACDFLVRTANQVLFRHTLNKWLDTGHIGPDTSEADLRSRSSALSGVFAETNLRPAVTKKIKLLALDPSA
jgi:hypothetical protein